MLSTGAPQGCVLSPLLFTLLTHECCAKFSSNHISMFADGTTVAGLIRKKVKTVYREEAEQLVSWCSNNNLPLNVNKIKEMFVDFKRAPADHFPLGSAEERVCTSLTTSPGPSTLTLQPRKHSNNSTSCRDWREPVCHRPSSLSSTEALWRLSSPVVFLCDMGTAKHQSARLYNALWGQLRKS